MRRFSRAGACLAVALAVAPVLSAAGSRGLSDWQLAFEPYYAARYGSVGEYVFDLSGWGTAADHAPDGSRQISRLDWDVLPLHVLGCGLSAGFRRIQYRQRLETGLPVPSGHMQDYDWASLAGHQTHYSFHENRVTRYFACDIRLGFEFPFAERRVILTPFVGIDFSEIAFLATDGFKQYVPAEDRATTPWSDDIERVAMAGDVITYRQTRGLLRLGLEARFAAARILTLSAEFYASPVWVDSFDSHLRTGMDYLDHRMSGAVCLEGGVAGEFRLTERQSLVLRLEGSWQSVASGTSYWKEASEASYSKLSGTLGGASRWHAGFSVGWKWRCL